jgi:hypothetical protein
VHVSRGGLDMGVAHQVAQHQQVDPGGSKLGPEGVTKPMRANRLAPVRARWTRNTLRRPGGNRESCTGGSGAAGTAERAPPCGDGSRRQCRRVGAISPTLG